MELTIQRIQGKIDELLVVLDEDIRHTQQSLSRLDEMRSLVVKRDHAALSKLLVKIEDESGSYSANESKRQSIRKELAVAFDCGVEEMTLSRLETVLAGEKKSQVARRRTRLKSLTEELKREQLKTSMLLSDCAKFNGVLLQSVLELGRTGVITYGSDGAARPRNDSAFVSMQF